jgi:hypothetical protein
LEAGAKEKGILDNQTIIEEGRSSALTPPLTYAATTTGQYILSFWIFPENAPIVPILLEEDLEESQKEDFIPDLSSSNLNEEFSDFSHQSGGEAEDFITIDK